MSKFVTFVARKASRLRPACVMHAGRLRLAVLACAASLTTHATAATWEASVAPRHGDAYDRAAFRLWMEDAAARDGRALKALLILAPGWNGDGRALVNDPEWQELARQLDAAILAVNLRTDLRGEHDDRRYHRAHLGSGEALQRALAQLAEASSRAELASLPWLVCGHSAGGQWGYGLANVFPERTAAFVAIKGGVYETAFDARSRQVPGLFIIGENDEVYRATAISSLFERERREGAYWAVAWDAEGGHEIGDTLPLARAFLRESAALRLPSASGKALLPLAGRTGWIGERSNYLRVNKPPVNPDGLVRTVWLPGPESGERWRELGEGTPARP